MRYRSLSKVIMPGLQEQYDDAMFAFSQGDFNAAIAGLREILRQDPGFFDAQLSLGMAFCRIGNWAAAIEEGHKAERLKPKEQLVHTNLSLFYLKAGDKTKAEHHGLQARIASWRDNPGPLTDSESDTELAMAKPPAQPNPTPKDFPDMPWKKKSQPKKD